MDRKWIGASFALAIGIAAISTMPMQTVAAEDNLADWPSYYRDDSGWRYSPLKQITTENVKDLKVAWMHQPGDIQDGLQSTPIVIGGVIYYIAANNNVFAVNGKTGETIWHYQPKLNPMIKQTFWAMRNRGVTVGHGMVYIGTADGRYIAIDQKTGKERWQTQLTDFKNCWGCGISRRGMARHSSRRQDCGTNGRIARPASG
jgi:alcohol dehydrogenase (cytochrome c)